LGVLLGEEPFEALAYLLVGEVLAVLEGFVAKLEGFLTVLEGFLAVLEGFVTKLEGFVAKLEGFLTVLEGFLAVLEGFLATLDRVNETASVVDMPSQTLCRAKPCRARLFWHRLSVARSFADRRFGRRRYLA
jgi:hypothetical protein